MIQRDVILSKLLKFTTHFLKVCFLQGGEFFITTPVPLKRSKCMVHSFILISMAVIGLKYDQ